MTTLVGGPLRLDLDKGFAPERRDVSRTSDGGGLRLSEKLDCLWEGLLATGVATCPVCGDRMRRDRAEARCGSCGSALS